MFAFDELKLYYNLLNIISDQFVFIVSKPENPNQAMLLYILPLTLSLITHWLEDPINLRKS